MNMIFKGQVLREAKPPMPPDCADSDVNEAEIERRIPVEEPEIVDATRCAEEILQDAEARQNSIIEAAQERADQIVQEAEARQNAIVESAEQRAELILQTARLEAEKSTEEAVAKALMEHRQAIGYDLQNSETELIAFIDECFTRITAELVPAEVISATVRRAIRDMMDQRGVKLKVSRDDYQSVQQALVADNAELPYPLTAVEIHYGLNPGQCFLDTGGAIVKMDLETQLGVVRSLMHGEGDGVEAVPQADD